MDILNGISAGHTVCMMGLYWEVCGLLAPLLAKREGEKKNK